MKKELWNSDENKFGFGSNEIENELDNDIMEIGKKKKEKHFTHTRNALSNSISKKSFICLVVGDLSSGSIPTILSLNNNNNNNDQDYQKNLIETNYTCFVDKSDMVELKIIGLAIDKKLSEYEESKKLFCDYIKISNIIIFVSSLVNRLSLQRSTQLKQLMDQELEKMDSPPISFLVGTCLELRNALDNQLHNKPIYERLYEQYQSKRVLEQEEIAELKKGTTRVVKRSKIQEVSNTMNSLEFFETSFLPGEMKMIMDHICAIAWKCSPSQKKGGSKVGVKWKKKYLSKYTKHTKSKGVIVEEDVNKSFSNERRLREKVERMFPETMEERREKLEFSLNQRRSFENHNILIKNFKEDNIEISEIGSNSPESSIIINHNNHKHNPNLNQNLYNLINGNNKTQNIGHHHKPAQSVNITINNVPNNLNKHAKTNSISPNNHLHNNIPLNNNLPHNNLINNNNINNLNNNTPNIPLKTNTTNIPLNNNTPNIPLNNNTPNLPNNQMPNLFEGFQTYTFPNGNQYSGNWKNGMFNGMGTLKLANGFIYIGNFFNGKFENEGYFSSPDGTFYKGSWKESKRNGKGEQKYLDGSRYTGEWKDDMKHGRGILDFPDGTSFIVQFNNDVLESQVNTNPYFNENNVGNNNNGVNVQPKQVEVVNETNNEKVEDHQNILKLYPFVTQLDRKLLTVADKKLGEGYYGVVYHGYYMGQQVAIKKLKQNIPENVLGKFIQEIHILSNMDHPNVVKYIGAILQDDLYCIVTEFINSGNLWDYVHNKTFQFNELTILKVSMDITSAMEYLHHLKPMIIHRDLKSPNILCHRQDMNQSFFSCKVADFGLSRFLENSIQEQQMTKGIGTAAWSAPEVVRWQEYTEKADIYSFAVIMWELWVRDVPFNGLTRDQVVLSVAMENTRPKIPKGVIPDHWKNLIESCWTTDPKQRPDFTEIRNKLGQFLDDFVQKPKVNVNTLNLPKLSPNPLNVNFNPLNINFQPFVNVPHNNNNVNNNNLINNNLNNNNNNNTPFPVTPNPLFNNPKPQPFNLNPLQNNFNNNNLPNNNLQPTINNLIQNNNLQNNLPNNNIPTFQQNNNFIPPLNNNLNNNNLLGGNLNFDNNLKLNNNINNFNNSLDFAINNNNNNLTPNTLTVNNTNNKYTPNKIYHTRHSSINHNFHNPSPQHNNVSNMLIFSPQPPVNNNPNPFFFDNYHDNNKDVKKNIFF